MRWKVPTRICDRTACDRLAKFFRDVPVRPHAESVDLYVPGRSGDTVLVQMDYCPFCGTRIGEDVTTLSVAPP